ncbi:MULTISPECIES: hypothetical protein [Pontibacillus]|uniref:Uncharacterized protein n=1 Tax=Pontibacillus chungwhensis TaxID=265426 RepID=A0ABY8V2Y7_9BACI|nr:MULTISPECIES: hypothetical protein [Pontibacillus]MCD5326158.1 hypothetical protein [Pontibacillus sp. HN14]WIG00327.1 hypothetical protein QNI29_20990 [Pontibacillus chungwhensis]
MGEVLKVNFRKREIWNTEECAGCFKKVDDGSAEVTIVKLPYMDSDEYIALCEGCYKVAKGYGVF